MIHRLLAGDARHVECDSLSHREIRCHRLQVAWCAFFDAYHDKQQITELQEPNLIGHWHTGSDQVAMDICEN